MHQALQDIVDTFASVDVPTRRMMLLEYSDQLPELPERYRLAMEHGAGRVHECQTPVYVYPVVEEDTVHIEAYAPPESPTVRGVVSILKEALSGASPDEVSQVPEDLFTQMGLVEAIGMMRQRGLAAVLHSVKHAVESQATS